MLFAPRAARGARGSRGPRLAIPNLLRNILFSCIVWRSATIHKAQSCVRTPGRRPRACAYTRYGVVRQHVGAPGQTELGSPSLGMLSITNGGMGQCHAVRSRETRTCASSRPGHAPHTGGNLTFRSA
eukprot:3730233-Prymnesium_polylepis.1